MSLNPTDSQTQTVTTLDFDAFEADKANDPHRFESASSSSQNSAIDYKMLYEAQREETAKLNAILEVTRAANSIPATRTDAKPLATFDQLHARLGWQGINKLSPQEKAVAVGLEAAPTNDEVLRYFGREATSQDASLLMRTDPKRYRRLREYGRLSRIL